MATYYVSKTATNGYVVGADGNSGVSKALAKFTIAAAVAAAVDGDTIYVNDGAYKNTELGAAGYIDIQAKALSLLPETAYGVTIASDTATILLRLRNDTSTPLVIGALVLDGEKPGFPGTYVPTGVQIDNPINAVSHTFDKTKFMNFSTQCIVDNALRGVLKCQNIVFAGFMKDGIQGGQFATASVKTYHIDGLTLSDVVTTDANASTVISAVRASTSNVAMSCYIRGITGTITAPASLGPTATVAIVVCTGITEASNLAGVVAPLTIEECDVTLYGYSTTNSCYGIQVVNSALGAAAKADKPLIRNNTIKMYAPAGYAILVGDTSTAYDVSNAVVYGNIVHMGYYPASTPHGIALGRVTGGRVFANKVYGGYVSFIAGINQGGVISGNISIGCYGFALYSKGCGATTPPSFSNNLVILRDIYGPSLAAAMGVAAQGGTNNAAVTFANNIVLAVSTLYRYVQVGSSQVGTFYNNCYWSMGPAGDATPWTYQASTYATFQLWRAARESSGVNVNPLLASDYRLLTESPLRHAGKFISHAVRDFNGTQVGVTPNIGVFSAGGGIVKRRLLTQYMD